MRTKWMLRKSILGAVIGIALISTSLLAAPANTLSTANTPVVLSDQQLADKVASAVRRYPYFDVFDWVTGSTKDGVVTLEGAVHQPFHKTDYGRLVAAIPGVKKVVNNLEVLPLSTFDDQLRRAAARAIYGDPSFVSLAMQANPPIHIIVEGGRIRLEGVVLNKMQRQVAEMNVRSRTMAFEVVNDLKTEA